MKGKTAALAVLTPGQIRGFRKRLGLTRKGLAEVLECSVHAVRHWEHMVGDRGHRVMPNKMAAKLITLHDQLLQADNL